MGKSRYAAIQLNKMLWDPIVKNPRAIVKALKAMKQAMKKAPKAMKHAMKQRAMKKQEGQLSIKKYFVQRCKKNAAGED